MNSVGTIVEIKDSLAAVSLVFTVLAFFVGRRVDRFDTTTVGEKGIMPVLEALLDVVLAAVAVLAIVIIWPLLDHSGAFGSFSAAEVMPNLLALVTGGFGALVLIEGFLAGARLLGLARSN